MTLMPIALPALPGWSIAAADAATVGAAAAHAGATLDPNEQYRAYLIDDVARSLAGARRLREQVAAHDLNGARQAWIDARVGWEQAEVFTRGFVSDLDEEIDAWPNALSGFHAIEVKLFGARTTDIGAEVDQLIYHLTDLDIKVRKVPLNTQGLLNGTARLAYEVGENKADGGESRYSGTSLDDMRNNVAGIQLAYKVLFAPTLQSADPQLAQDTDRTIHQLTTLLSVGNVSALEPDKVRATSEELIVALQATAPKIGLRKPTLEDITQ
ncbi:MAG TPA: EfeM/EfeO family lipoprotein [Steroidobacteraceae bacterium]